MCGAHLRIFWNSVEVNLSGKDIKCKDIKCKDNEFVTLVDVNYDEYKKQHSTKAVRRNVTLPSWINYAADKSGINVSALLAKALKDELHLSDR